MLGLLLLAEIRTLFWRADRYVCGDGRAGEVPVHGEVVSPAPRTNVDMRNTFDATHMRVLVWRFREVLWSTEV